MTMADQLNAMQAKHNLTHLEMWEMGEAHCMGTAQWLSAQDPDLNLADCIAEQEAKRLAEILERRKAAA